MKLKWIVLCGLALWVAQASAEEALVIDAQTLGVQSTTQAADTQPADAQTPAADTQVTATPAADAQPADAQPADGSGTALSTESTTSQVEAIKDRMPKDKMSPRQRAAMAKIELADENKRTGEAFQNDYRNRTGVVVLPSGVMYKILRAGKGRKPGPDSLVVCRLRGTLIDGTVFETTDPKKSMSTYVSAFLPGLKEGVMLMPEGSKWQIVVPPQLAYRDLGNRGVGPNATVIYEMELFSVK